MPTPLRSIDSFVRWVVEERQSLSRSEAKDLLDLILAEGIAGAELKVAALLGALSARGETVDEIAGFVDSLRSSVTPIPLSAEERARLVDTCGTGGDGGGTFNISTASALVAAAAGALVAKHGNRAVTSRSGSADVLEALGIPVDLSPTAAAAAIRTHGFAFLPAPMLQPAMRAVMPIRRALGIRTVFNILGPMTNPAGARAQVLGVNAAHLVPVVAKTLSLLDTRHAFVVHGSSGQGESAAVSQRSGMDEFSISGPTHYAEVRGAEIEYGTLLPEDVGIATAPTESLAGGDAQTNADILTRIFAGESGPRRDVVLLNAAAVLVTAGLATNFHEGMTVARETIDSGKVAVLVSRLAG